MVEELAGPSIIPLLRPLALGGVVDGGFRTAGRLIEHVTGISARAAASRVRIARRAGRRSELGRPVPALFPHAGEALREGVISADAADLITGKLASAARRIDPALLGRAEQALIAAATGTPVPDHDADDLDDAADAEADLTGLGADALRDRIPVTHTQLGHVADRVLAHIDADGPEPHHEDLMLNTNGALLSRYHHRMLDTDHWTITLTNGRARLTLPPRIPGTSHYQPRRPRPHRKE